ncbi:enoyl-CoA hydratase/isomerase family protein [Paraburkholderia sp. J63]|uniref:enoyl-CoA hydratase/isomerase family protein n=1 Tax=Paraburkholderia sp. J63 TaxID=2805434 RepID=UPI002ABD8584|nr:enoyl-CoA hydratase-related protein [Paraburkholderia sp. J63]
MTHESSRDEVRDAGTLPILTRYGDWAELRLNRPSVHNRLEPSDIVALRSAIDALNADTAIRVVMLTGTGHRTFCSGFHLGAFEAMNSNPNEAFEELVDAVETMRPLTIARVNGSMYGGAADLVLACDFRIGVAGSTMTVPAARIGLHFYGHGLRRWVSRVGVNVAKQAFLAARTFASDELLACEFYSCCLKPEQLDTACTELIDQLRAMAPSAVQGMKQIINAAAVSEYDHVRASSQHLASLGTEDFAEGRAALAEKRVPVFKGK